MLTILPHTMKNDNDIGNNIVILVFTKTFIDIINNIIGIAVSML